MILWVHGNAQKIAMNQKLQEKGPCTMCARRGYPPINCRCDNFIKKWSSMKRHHSKANFWTLEAEDLDLFLLDISREP